MSREMMLPYRQQTVVGDHEFGFTAIDVDMVIALLTSKINQAENGFVDVAPDALHRWREERRILRNDPSVLDRLRHVYYQIGDLEKDGIGREAIGEIFSPVSDIRQVPYLFQLQPWGRALIEAVRPFQQPTREVTKSIVPQETAA